MRVDNQDQSLIVDISDALSERDRVRFTVHTRTKLDQFAKQNMSVVRQHEEFIWLHDCLEDNDQYAGYIIPPAPPKPDFDASREKLQRLGDGEASMSKGEFTKMKQELEAEYLAIFKKTVAMHEIFLQRLAAHEKFRHDHNFKIFLEYENELAVRCKSKKERLAGSLQNISKSLTDFVITTSQVAATTSASSSLITGVGATAGQSPIKRQPLSSLHEYQQHNGNTDSNSTSDIGSRSIVASDISSSTSAPSISNQTHEPASTLGQGDGNNNLASDGHVDEQYFERERLFLALYYNSIRDTAIQADKVTQIQKCLADNYLHIAQQLVKLAGIEVLPITTQTKDASSFVACKLPSLTLPASLQSSDNDNHEINLSSSASSSSPSTSNQVNTTVIHQQGETSKLKLIDQSANNQLDTSISLDDDDDDYNNHKEASKDNKIHESDSGETSSSRLQDPQQSSAFKTSLAQKNTSEGLKQLLLHVSDYFEQARKVETRIASDEDLKLTDTFLYYKRDTVAAQDLLVRRLRFLAEYETATKNLDKARQKGRTQLQYAELIQKQAKENLISISKLAKQELADYKMRRVASFRKAFNELVELELKHLRSHSQLIMNCLNTCRGLVGPGDKKVN